MRLIKRILFFISGFLVYVIVKEFLDLYQASRALHPIIGYMVLGTIFAFILYFIGIPIYRIIRLPKNYGPIRDPDKITELIQKRFKTFKTNPYLRRSSFDLNSVAINRDGYLEIIKIFRKEMENIRKKYVTQVFYATSIAQNGFLDAVLILSSSVNMVKELFTLYNGRVSNRDLFTIAKMVYYSMIIGGSEGVEYATDEILSKVFSKSVKSLPFGSKILGSIADGFVNAVLLTRVSLIAENYCTLLFIESDRALLPSYRTVISTTRIVTSDLIERIVKEVKHLTRDKTERVLSEMMNPVGYIIGKAVRHPIGDSEKMTAHQKAVIREVSTIVNNPFSYTFRKVVGLFKTKRKMEHVNWDYEEQSMDLLS